MPLPMTSLDDRRFEDLSAEARQRLQRHLPDVAHMAEGDPLFALTDLFAWMTESVIYRTNLIPERQRRAFLNLLQLPMRPARPARGIVSIDAKSKSFAGNFPPFIPAESRMAAGEVTVTTEGDVQPLPLSMALMMKKPVSPDELKTMGISEQSLTELYGAKTRAFQPVTLTAGVDRIQLTNAQDKRLYCLLYLNDKALVESRDDIRDALAGTILNIGVSPEEQQDGDIAGEVAPRQLKWHIAWQAEGNGKKATYLPLEVIDDTSDGGRKTGVVRIRLPKSKAVLRSQFAQDSKFAGVNNTPPEPPADVDPTHAVAWLTLSAPDEDDVDLSYLAINAVEVAAHTIVRDELIGHGDGRPGQVAQINQTNIDANTLVLQVSELGSYVTWQAVDHFAASGREDRVFVLDPATGTVRFGDGIRGKRPEPSSRIRVEYARAGGGEQGNLPAGAIKQLTDVSPTRYILRHEWPLQDGLNQELVSEAEQRISSHLSHRNRAITLEDFQTLTRDNPVCKVARAEPVAGFFPGNRLENIRTNVPGVVSVFVMPPSEPAFAAAPRPSVGMLRDVYQYLDRRKPLTTEHFVLSPEFVPVAISVSVDVIDPSTTTQTLSTVQNGLLNFLWALAPGGVRGQGWPMGRTLDVNEIKTAAARQEGVLAVNHLRLFYFSKEGDWLEADNVVLQSFQLPEVMSIDVELGDQVPEIPSLTAPDDDPDNDAMPVPIIPDLC